MVWSRGALALGQEFRDFFYEICGAPERPKILAKFAGLDISSNFSLHFGARGALPIGLAQPRSAGSRGAGAVPMSNVARESR